MNIFKKVGNKIYLNDPAVSDGHLAYFEQIGDTKYARIALELDRPCPEWKQDQILESVENILSGSNVNFKNWDVLLGMV